MLSINIAVWTMHMVSVCSHAHNWWMSSSSQTSSNQRLLHSMALFTSTTSMVDIILHSYGKSQNLKRLCHSACLPHRTVAFYPGTDRGRLGYPVPLVQETL